MPWMAATPVEIYRLGRATTDGAAADSRMHRPRSRSRRGRRPARHRARRLVRRRALGGCEGQATQVASAGDGALTPVGPKKSLAQSITNCGVSSWIQ